MRKYLGTFYVTINRLHMGDIKVHLGSMPEPKSSYNFVCKCCDFKCSRQSQYDRHLSTRKHIDAYNGYKIDDISTKKFQKVPRVYVVNRINIAKAYIITKRSVRSFKRILKKSQRKSQRLIETGSTHEDTIATT